MVIACCAWLGCEAPYGEREAAVHVACKQKGARRRGGVIGLRLALGLGLGPGFGLGLALPVGPGRASCVHIGG
jgi:hypothetical protein